MMHLGLKIGFRGEKMMVLQVRHDRGIRRLQIICSTKNATTCSRFQNQGGASLCSDTPNIRAIKQIPITWVWVKIGYQ